MKANKGAFLKFVLTVVLTATAGMGMLYLFELGQFAFAEVDKFAILAALGVVAGFFSRWILGKHTGMLRLLTALFSVIASLSVIDWISQGYMGIDLLDFDHPYPDWDSLIQMGVPALVSMFALSAWKRKKPKSESAPAPQRPAPAHRQRPEPIPMRQPVLALASAGVDSQPLPRVNLKRTKSSGSSLINKLNALPSVISLPSLGSKKACPPAARKTSLKVAATKSPTVFRPASTAKAKPVSVKKAKPAPAKKSSKKKNDHKVSFVGAEEHRCPFCLEEVNLHDPRGVEICPICKTYHHKDCWDITGVCQVPHYQD